MIVAFETGFTVGGGVGAGGFHGLAVELFLCPHAFAGALDRHVGAVRHEFAGLDVVVEVRLERRDEPAALADWSLWRRAPSATWPAPCESWWDAPDTRPADSDT